MKKSFKKILASLLVAVMVLSVSPIDSISEIDFSSLFSVKAAALTSGKFTYELSGTNATITGYSGTDSNLTIPSKLDGNTVVAIKHGVFANNTDLISVSIPSTVTRISDTNTAYGGAFWECKKLQSVTIAEGTKDASIGYKTFYGCTSLQSIDIPGNYTSIYSEAFSGCKSLKSLNWEKSDYTQPNQFISNSAFTGCSSLETVTLPTTLKSIGQDAFAGCGIVNLVIPEGVTTIEKGAFANNNELRTVSLPSTLTRISDTGTAYGGAFWECKKLQSVTIAKGAKDASIGYKTFYGCTSLQSIDIPGNYTSIYSEAFSGCKSLKSLNWEKSDYVYANQFIGNSAFIGCSSLENITLPTTLKSIGQDAFSNCGIINLVIPEGVTTIEKGAFANNNELRTVSLPSTLTRISDTGTAYGGAFWECKNLQSVTIAKGAKDASIGYKTFYGCTSLQSIDIPGNYTSIYSEAFSGCKSLKSLSWEKSDYVYANQFIGNSAFIGCSSLENITLPTTLKSIGQDAFSNCGIINLVIPEGVTTIEKGAFANNANLKTVSLPSTLTRISDTNTAYGGAFWECKNLETVIFEEGTKDLYIGYKTFYGCSSLTVLHLPLNLKEIKSESFVNKSPNLTICSKSNNSYGKTFADSNSIKFKVCSGHVTSVIGDVNNDGNINSSDALLVLQYSVGSYALNGNAFTAADTNRDGKVNSSDALIILQFAVGKINKI